MIEKNFSHVHRLFGHSFDLLEEGVLISVDLVLSFRGGEIPLGVLLGNSNFSLCTLTKDPSCLFSSIVNRLLLSALASLALASEGHLLPAEGADRLLVQGEVGSLVWSWQGG